MRQLPDDPTTILIPASQESLYCTAIRLTTAADPAAVLAHLAGELTALTTALGGQLSMYIEPTGDACDTGNWVDICCDHGTLWAEMTPHPSRFGGTIPPQIDLEQELAGWVLIDDSDDHHVNDLPSDDTGTFELQCLDGPYRRLVAEASMPELREWADLVTHSICRVIDPHARTWYLHGRIDVVDLGPLHDPPFASSLYAGEWSVDLGSLLEPSLWDRAVWPADSEGGAIACDLGLHQFHEPPCPPPPIWSRRYSVREERDGDVDL